jgi:hypothetical protein
MRGGTSPEVPSVAFELLTEGSGEWTPLGAGVRVAGGWQLTGLSLPAAGTVRARARLTGGSRNSSSAPLEEQSTWHFPDITVEQPAGTTVPENAAVDFGILDPGSLQSRTFVIHNNGAADLSGLSLTIEGTDAPAFSVTVAPAASLPAGGVTECTVTFNSSAPGTKSVALRFSAGGFDDIFDLTLSGRALSSLEAWRQLHFETLASEGIAADNADPDGDGIENLIEFAFGLNPSEADASSLPRWHWEDDDLVLSFDAPRKVNGVTYIAEYNTSLSSAGWTAIPNASEPPGHIFFAPVGTAWLFLRLRVTTA